MKSCPLIEYDKRLDIYLCEKKIKEEVCGNSPHCQAYPTEYYYNRGLEKDVSK